MHRKWLWFLLLVCSLPSFEGRALPTDWSERIAHAQMLATTSDPTDQVIKTMLFRPSKHFINRGSCHQLEMDI